MNVRVQLFASLGRHAPHGGGNDPFPVALNEGATVSDLLDLLAVPVEVVKLVFVNGVHASGERCLKDGDRVGVFPPVAGG